jgi:uncharacterized protein
MQKPIDTSLRATTVITGASSGIGRALALLAAKESAVLLVARSASALKTVALEIEAAGGKAEVLPLDVTAPEAAVAIRNKLTQSNAYVDILINNAGYGLIGEANQLDANDQLGMIDLNCRALTDLSLAFLPEMKVRGRGGILNVASMAGFAPGPGMAIYYASKAYVLSFSQALWQEMRSHHVTVSALCPGPVRTAFFDRATGGKAKPDIFKMLPSISSEEAALAGWRGFKAGKRVVFPTFFNRLSIWGMLLTPKALLLPVVAKLQAARAKVG